MKGNIKLTESDLNKIVKLSISKVLNESSYDSNGDFNAEQHNEDLLERFFDVTEKLYSDMGDTMNHLNAISTAAMDEKVAKNVRIVINAILKAQREIHRACTLIAL
jgi:hypothetical protein